jgi:hypothetical protein
MEKIMGKMREEKGSGMMVASIETVGTKINTDRSPIADNVFHTFSQRFVHKHAHGPTPRARVMAVVSVAIENRA